MNIEEFLNNAKKCWYFAIDVAWDQNMRHNELSRGTCLKDRSFLRSLLGTDQAKVFTEAVELADKVATKAEMDVLLPKILEYMKEKFPPTLESNEYEEGLSIRYATLANNYCYIHFRNAKRPDSFLNCPEYFAQNLKYIMDKAQKEHNCDTLYTATWLNSLPKFLRFFPQEWHDNLKDTIDFGATLGLQGQFINSAGLLNEATAKKFLETGVLPYARRESHCSFEEMRKHLTKLGF